jgi:F-box and WD-40 domain protein 1/11
MHQQQPSIDEAFQTIASQPSSVLWNIGHRLLNLTKRDFLANLPIEIASAILSLTDAHTLSIVSRVSKIHHDLCLDSSIWRILFFRRDYKVDSALLLNSLQELYNFRNVTDHILVDDINVEHDTSQDITYGTLDRNESGGSKASADTTFQPLPVIKEYICVDEVLSPHDAVVDWKWIYRHRLQLERNWAMPYRLDPHSGQLVAHGYRSFEFLGHEEAVYCLQFDRDKIVSGSRDGK